ncbi:hypothetical protein PRIPAC_70006 [Pristionchus pacificus]|uniref:Uncharacterized protein n=1 Tax=Pristionchus pacificus TaxID=54126 RepID=A0A454Y3B4_PRIPA|nr:hypothetical protein PRIPAC_70006 [Pristionchus pacificus]|eukprot:PDM71638.1 hypothetical protein PRIPAC_38045 [Pristionchus pacificus]
MLRVVFIASLLLVLSECSSAKWDANWEDTVAGVPDAKDIAMFDKKERNGICYWQGGFWCSPGNECDDGYRYVASSRQNAYNEWAGDAGAFCWFGERWLCCESDKVKKNPKTSCTHGGGQNCGAGKTLIWWASWNEENLCCEDGTIVP